MRWWREFRNPKLKCKRLGHAKKRYSSRVYVEPEHLGIGSGVADSAVMSQTACKRCGAKLSGRHISGREPIHSLLMPRSMWSHMEKHGYVPTDYWRERDGE